MILVRTLCAAAVLACLPAAPASAAPAFVPFSACPNLGYQVQSADGKTSEVGYFDLATSTFVPIRNIGSAVNAVGYSKRQGAFWGMRTNPTNDTLVRIDSKGNTVDMGPLDGVASVRTNTGTVDDADRMILHTKNPANELVVVDVDPTGGTVGAVLDRQVLSRTSPGLSYLEIGDWDFNPADGLLYALEMQGDTTRLLVSVDPSSGAVRTVLDLSTQLPDGHNYGAVYVEDVSGTVYVSNNDVDDLRDRGKPGARSQTFGIYPSLNPPAVVAYQPGKPLLINDGADCLLATDHGDAPDSYRTVTRSGGPGHVLTGSAATGARLTIGDVVDPDLDGVPGPGADGDDMSLAVDDEDGVASGIAIDPDLPAVDVPVVNTTRAAATLAAWLDLDADGTFDVSERVVADVPAAVERAAAPTRITLRWRVPESARIPLSTSTYLRLRLYPGTVASPEPAGLVDGGEVEDHRVSLGALPVSGVDTRGRLLAGGGLLLLGVIAVAVVFRRVRFTS